METSQAPPRESPRRRIKQKRGRESYEAFVTTGFRLLESRDFEAITIAELAREAGYSVGAFYARFRSKDEFFDALIEHHMEERTLARRQLFETLSDEKLIGGLMKNVVGYYWRRRRFWRAALIRSTRDPVFWEPIRRHGHEFADMMIERMRARTHRHLSRKENTNVRFAFQILLGTINNTIINRPGPIFMGQTIFEENLGRAFRLVSDYDKLMGVNSNEG